jgi:hypothetical protein
MSARRGTRSHSKHNRGRRKNVILICKHERGWVKYMHTESYPGLEEGTEQGKEGCRSNFATRDEERSQG